MLKPSFTGHYCQVAMSVNCVVWYPCVHLLAAWAFHGPKPGDGYEVNHDNADKLDNRDGNLEWLPPGGNQKHAATLGLLPRGAAMFRRNLRPNKCTKSGVFWRKALAAIGLRRASVYGRPPYATSATA